MPSFRIWDDHGGSDASRRVVRRARIELEVRNEALPLLLMVEAADGASQGALGASASDFTICLPVVGSRGGMEG